MNKRKSVRKRYKALPPHTWEAHPGVKDGEVSKPLIISIIAILAITALAMLLFFTDVFVGHAITMGSLDSISEADGGIFLTDATIGSNEAFTVNVSVNSETAVQGVRFVLDLDSVDLAGSCEESVKSLLGWDEGTVLTNISCDNGLITFESATLNPDVGTYKTGAFHVAELSLKSPDVEGNHPLTFTEHAFYDQEGETIGITMTDPIITVEATECGADSDCESGACNNGVCVAPVITMALAGDSPASGTVEQGTDDFLFTKITISSNVETTLNGFELLSEGTAIETDYSDFYVMDGSNKIVLDSFVLVLLKGSTKNFEIRADVSADAIAGNTLGFGLSAENMDSADDVGPVYGNNMTIVAVDGEDWICTNIYLNDGGAVFDLDGVSNEVQLSNIGTATATLLINDESITLSIGEKSISDKLKLNDISSDNVNICTVALVVPVVTNEINCFDSVDDDSDTFLDCADRDCWEVTEIINGQETDHTCFEMESCFDGFDNNGDGSLDCDDDDCTDVEGCQEVESLCGTVIDTLEEQLFIDENLTCTGNAITITANGVLIDCLGNTIKSSNRLGIGVNISSANGVYLRNCNVIGFNTGLLLENAENAVVSESTFKNNTDNGIKIIGGNANGIYDNNVCDNDFINSNFDDFYCESSESLMGSGNFFDTITQTCSNINLSYCDCSCTGNCVDGECVEEEDTGCTLIGQECTLDGVDNDLICIGGQCLTPACNANYIEFFGDLVSAVTDDLTCIGSSDCTEGKICAQQETNEKSFCVNETILNNYFTACQGTPGLCSTKTIVTGTGCSLGEGDCYDLDGTNVNCNGDLVCGETKEGFDDNVLFCKNPPTTDDVPPVDDTPQTPSSSGGGSNYCSSNWKCGTWSFCNATLKQTRTCQDLKNCKADKVEEQNCTKCVESWTCQVWTDCSNEVQSRTCVDSHICGTSLTKPALQRACEGTVTTPGLPGYTAPGKIDDFVQQPTEPTVQQPTQQSLWQKAWTNYKALVIAIPTTLILMIVLLIVLIMHYHHKHKHLVYNFDELTEWIGKERAAGTSDEDIRHILINQTGWTDEEVNNAFSGLSAS